MAITATTKEEAWNLAIALMPGCCKKDKEASTAAGYDIYKDENGNWISCLEGRFEINFINSGESHNIWIAHDDQMKSREQIESIIKTIEEQIVVMVSSKREALAKVTNNLNKNVDNLEYVAKWISTWMGEVALYENKISELYVKMEIYSDMLKG